jgi:hypothetical protein
MLGTTEPVSRARRRRTKGLARLRNKKYYRQKRQEIKRKSKAWRRQHRSQIKQYERRRKVSPQLYKLLHASTLLDHPIFDPNEDVSLREREITSWDVAVSTLGFVDWIDLDEGAIHTVVIDGDARLERVYGIYDFMDRAVLLFESDEQLLLAALDAIHAMAPEDETEENAPYDYDRRDPIGSPGP